MIDTHCSVLCSDLNVSLDDQTVRNNVEDVVASRSKYKKQCEELKRENDVLQHEVDDLRHQVNGLHQEISRQNATVASLRSK